MKRIAVVVGILLLTFGAAAKAEDKCDTIGDYPEAGLCKAYCSAMKCDSLTDAKATEAACRNVATTFVSFRLIKPRRDVTSGETADAIVELNTNLCCVTDCPCDPDTNPNTVPLLIRLARRNLDL